jgi:hypothetical protein
MPFRTLWFNASVCMFASAFHESMLLSLPGVSENLIMPPSILTAGSFPTVTVELAVGEDVGAWAGEDVGERVGEDVGERVGEDVGERVGEDVGERVGEDVGESVSVGEDVGAGGGGAPGGQLPRTCFFSEGRIVSVHTNEAERGLSQTGIQQHQRPHLALFNQLAFVCVIVR